MDSALKIVISVLFLVCAAGAQPAAPEMEMAADSTVKTGSPETPAPERASAPGKAETVPVDAGDFENPFADSPAGGPDSGASELPKITGLDSAMRMGKNGAAGSGSITGLNVTSQKPLLDLLLDMSLGFGLSLFSIESPFYSTQGRGDVNFSLGFIIPFLERFYGGAGVRFLRAKYRIRDSVSDLRGSYFTYKDDESLSFVSVPVKAGVKFETSLISPYGYVICEPAFLTASGRLINRKSSTLFMPDSAVFTVATVEDSSSTRNRTRVQVFAGAGFGAEINYGYGALYIDAGVLVALRETGYLSFKPGQGGANRLMLFPVTCGVRFYL